MQPLRAAVVVLVAVAVAVVVLARMGGVPNAVAVAKETSTTHRPRPALTPTTTSTTVAPTTTTTLAPSSVTVLVLNGWTTNHAAKFFKTKLAGLGYDTRAPEDALSSTNRSSNIFVVSPSFRSNALTIAGLVHLPASAVVSPAPTNDAAVPPSDLTGVDLVLLVGQDISAQVPSGYT
ncbi:MAG: LytR C-terminal domain-containing protein [Acidimicrobiales bacterium]